jgi:DNA repair exonuclease SbcCD ATPase subunit
VNVMTVKDTITRELLDCAGDPGEVEAIFQKYSRSKGPLYNALAEATNQLRGQLEGIRDEVIESTERRDELKNDLESLSVRRDELNAEVHSLDQQARETVEFLAQSKVLLDKATDLEKRGFGEEELNQLFNLLGEIAVSKGDDPREGVVQFFQLAKRYQEVISLELEGKRLTTLVNQYKAESERWEAEAKRREVQSKARIATIDVVERLLLQGVKAEDLPIWERILAKSKATPQEFATAIEECGSLQGLINKRQKQADRLQENISKLQSEVSALKEERNQVHSAIVAIRESALEEVKSTKNRMAQELEDLSESVCHYSELIAEQSERYGRLQEQADELDGFVKVARAIRRSENELWQIMPREVILHILCGALKWAQAAHNDADVQVGICEKIDFDIELCTSKNVTSAVLGARWSNDRGGKENGNRHSLKGRKQLCYLD